MEADNVGPKFLDDLHRIARWRQVGNCNPAAMPSQRIRGDNAVSNGPASVDAICEFSFLKYAWVYIDLGNTYQLWPQTSVPSVTDIVGAKPNRLPPSGRNPSTPAHPLPTYAFSPSLLHCPPRSRHPPPYSIPVLSPITVLPYPPYSIPFTSEWGTL